MFKDRNLEPSDIVRIKVFDICRAPLLYQRPIESGLYRSGFILTARRESHSAPLNVYKNDIFNEKIDNFFWVSKFLNFVISL